MITCRDCGAEVTEDGAACPACGTYLAGPSNVPALERGNEFGSAPFMMFPETLADGPGDLGTPHQHSHPPFLARQHAPALSAVQAAVSPALLKKKSRLEHWFILSMVVLLLLVGVGAFVYANRSTPTKTLQTACNASKNGDFHTAYDQFSSAFKSKVGDERAFADSQRQFFLSRGGLLDCTVARMKEEGTSASATLILVYGDGSTLTDDMILLQEQGEWRILSANIRA